MSDIKLFRTANDTVAELSGGAVALERSLQLLFEKNLEALLGVRFLASEFVVEGGRMDTIGIDENRSPVIIEYKRATNENGIAWHPHPETYNHERRRVATRSGPWASGEGPGAFDRGSRVARSLLRMSG